MLVSEDEGLVAQARFLAAQARDPMPHYSHSTLGYNYRMSNLLAAVGRAQLDVLEQRIGQRLAVCEFYRSHLGDLPGLDFMPETDYGQPTHWLTCIQIDPQWFGVDREAIRLALEEENIESRPVWMPLHMQRLFEGCEVAGGRVSEEIFRKGLCLPSSSSLGRPDLERIVGIIRKTCAAVRKPD